MSLFQHKWKTIKIRSWSFRWTIFSNCIIFTKVSFTHTWLKLSGRQLEPVITNCGINLMELIFEIDEFSSDLSLFVLWSDYIVAVLNVISNFTLGGAGDSAGVPMGRPRPLPLPPYNMQGLGMDFGGLGTHHSTPSTVMVDFLMPNSIIIQHSVSTSSSLEEIKEVCYFLKYSSEMINMTWLRLSGILKVCDFIFILLLSI